MSILSDSPFNGPCTRCGRPVLPETMAKLSLRIENDVSEVVERLCRVCLGDVEWPREEEPGS